MDIKAGNIIVMMNNMRYLVWTVMDKGSDGWSKVVIIDEQNDRGVMHIVEVSWSDEAEKWVMLDSGMTFIGGKDGSWNLYVSGPRLVGPIKGHQLGLRDPKFVNAWNARNAERGDPQRAQLVTGNIVDTEGEWWTASIHVTGGK